MIKRKFVLGDTRVARFNFALQMRKRKPETNGTCELHPSPSFKLPSSHCSGEIGIPSPQTARNETGEEESSDHSNSYACKWWRFASTIESGWSRRKFESEAFGRDRESIPRHSTLKMRNQQRSENKINAYSKKALQANQQTWSNVTRT